MIKKLCAALALGLGMTAVLAQDIAFGHDDRSAHFVF